MDRRSDGGGGDPDQGGAPDGTPRRGDCAGVRQGGRVGPPVLGDVIVDPLSSLARVAVIVPVALRVEVVSSPFGIIP